MDIPREIRVNIPEGASKAEEDRLIGEAVDREVNAALDRDLDDFLKDL